MGVVLLVGEQPPERMWNNPALREKINPLFPYPPRCAGARLHEISDYGLGEYIWGLERVNLIPEYRKWIVREAVSRAKDLMNRYHPTIVFACGRRVATAFGLPEDAAMPTTIIQHVFQPAAKVHYIPHPSGRNHAYNDQEIRDRVRAMFAEARPLVQDWQDKMHSKRADFLRQGGPIVLQSSGQQERALL